MTTRAFYPTLGESSGSSTAARLAPSMLKASTAGVVEMTGVAPLIEAIF